MNFLGCYIGRIAIQLALLIMSVASLTAGELYLLSGEPTWTTKAGSPWPFHILKLEGSTLSSSWTNGPDTPIFYVDTYGLDSRIVLTTGGTQPRALFSFYSNDLSSPDAEYAFGDNVVAVNHQLAAATGKTSMIQIRPISVDMKTSAPTRLTLDATSLKQVTGNYKSTDYDLRLSGMTSSYSHAPSNGTRPLVLVDSVLTLVDSGLQLDVKPIGADLMPSQEIRGWILIAHEKDFLAVLPLPILNQNATMVLIFNRTTLEWSSKSVPGGETRLRLVNGYLIGTVCQPNPETRPVDYYMLPSIVTDSAVILNPLAAKLISFTLGKDNEVIWIDSDTLYYRLDTHLYRALIQNGDLVDKQLILSDPRVEHVHWALRK